MDARRHPVAESRREAAALFLEAWLLATIVIFVTTGCLSFGASVLLLGLDPTAGAVQTYESTRAVLTFPSSLFLDSRTGFPVFALNSSILGGCLACARRALVSRRS